jgi:SPP1 family predicted phage head-tail adaptor
MRAGDLNRRVRIRKWTDVPTGGMGGFGGQQVFDPGVTVWAFIRPTGAALFYGTQQIQGGITHEVVVRRNSVLTEALITSEHVVEHKGIRYRVHRAKNVDDADTWVAIDVEQLGAIA